MKKLSSKGFTLIELMVVLVIIGILATMAIPKFLGASNKAKATECKPVLKEIYTLQKAYHMEQNKYNTADSIGFTVPDGDTRYTYTATATTTKIGIATAIAGKIDGVAATDKACIDTVSTIRATANLVGLLSVGGSGC